MKRMNKFFTLVFAALAFTAFTACSDDDDDNKVLTVNDIVGTYAGSLACCRNCHT